jgi:hypothetical protein
MAERCRGREWSHPPWSPRPHNTHEGPWDGDRYPAGYKLVRRAPHARKGLALDRNEAQTNEERQRIFGDLFDDVTDLGAPSSPAPLAHRFAAAGLDRTPKSVTRRLFKIAKGHRNPLTAAPSYKSRCDAVALGSNISVPAPFVWRCLSGSTVTPFPHLAHRTGQAELPHPALGHDLTPSPTARRVLARLDVRARGARRGARVDKSRPCVV